MTTIKIFAALCVVFFLTSIYFRVRLRYRKLGPFMALFRIFSGNYGGPVFFLLNRRGRDKKETSIILKANATLLLFWMFLIIAVVMVMIYLAFGDDFKQF